MTERQATIIKTLPDLIHHSYEHHRMCYELAQKQYEAMLSLFDQLIKANEILTGDRNPTILRWKQHRDLMVKDWEKENEFQLEGGDLLQKIEIFSRELLNLAP